MNDFNNSLDVKQFLSLLGITSVNGDTDDDLIISYGGESENEIYIDVEKALKNVYCPNCYTKMYSKEPIIRKVKHPVLQNGKVLIIRLK